MTELNYNLKYYDNIYGITFGKCGSKTVTSRLIHIFDSRKDKTMCNGYHIRAMKQAYVLTENNHHLFCKTCLKNFLKKYTDEHIIPEEPEIIYRDYEMLEFGSFDKISVWAAECRDITEELSEETTKDVQKMLIRKILIELNCDEHTIADYFAKNSGRER